jgi:hypothetical protein
MQGNIRNGIALYLFMPPLKLPCLTQFQSLPLPDFIQPISAIV